MRDYEVCFGCGSPMTQRGFLMVTDRGKDVVVCERCKRLWENRKAKEAEIRKDADDE